MAGDWMKVEKATPRKPEILEMAEMLELSPDDVFGKCFRVWSWCDDHTQDGNAHGVTPALLDSTLSVTGFARALEAVGWLEPIERSEEFPRGGIRFVNFDRHNGKTAKSRANTAKRVAKHKEKARSTANGPGVTLALPREEKRREEKSINSLSPRAEIPCLDKAQGFTTEWSQWCLFRLAQDGRPMNEIQADAVLMELTRRGIPKARADLTFSIQKGARTVCDSDNDYDAKRADRGNGRKPKPSRF